MSESNRLKAILKKKKINMYTLAVETGVSEKKIIALCEDMDEGMYLNTANRICEFLKCDFDKVFGDRTYTRLKRMIMERNISQKALAAGSDIKQYKISNLCNNINENVYMSTAKRICEFLDCTLDEAFGDRDYSFEDA